MNSTQALQSEVRGLRIYIDILLAMVVFTTGKSLQEVVTEIVNEKTSRG